jgi:hypothetical protein
VIAQTIHQPLDSVRLARDIPDAGLHRGDIGAIVEVFADGTCEVEFVAASGRTQALLTLPGADLQPLEGRRPTGASCPPLKSPPAWSPASSSSG